MVAEGLTETTTWWLRGLLVPSVGDIGSWSLGSPGWSHKMVSRAAGWSHPVASERDFRLQQARHARDYFVKIISERGVI